MSMIWAGDIKIQMMQLIFSLNYINVREFVEDEAGTAGRRALIERRQLESTCIRSQDPSWAFTCRQRFFGKTMIFAYLGLYPTLGWCPTPTPSKSHGVGYSPRTWKNADMFWWNWNYFSFDFIPTFYTYFDFIPTFCTYFYIITIFLVSGFYRQVLFYW